MYQHSYVVREQWVLIIEEGPFTWAIERLPHVRLLLGSDRVHFEVTQFRVLTDHHPRVNLLGRLDEEDAWK